MNVFIPEQGLREQMLSCAARSALPDAQVRAVTHPQRVSIIKLPKRGRRPKTVHLVSNLLNYSQPLSLVQPTSPARRELPYNHYFLIILGKLLSSGEFGLARPDALFPYFIFCLL